MPRPSKPWWWEARGRWATTIEGRRVVAPPEIGEGDVHAAWAWHAGVLAGGACSPIATVRGLFEAYLQWDEGRISSGDRERTSHAKVCSACQKILDTPVPGGPFKAMKLSAVKEDHLQALVKAWAKAGHSPGYRRALVIRVKTVFRWGSRRVDGRPPVIAASPFADVPPPQVSRADDRFATRKEAAAWLRWLWRSGRRDLARLQRCLIHTGARPSELTRAAWPDLRWDGDSPAVLTRLRWKCSAKTGRPRRVYLPRRLHRMLRRMESAGEGGLIFRTPRGLPWSQTNLSAAIAKLRKKAVADKVGISDSGADRLTNYRWRHTAASSLLMSNVPIAVVAELLGTSPEMIAKTYGHILPGRLADAADALARRRE